MDMFPRTDGSMCPTITARLSSLFLKELWVNTSMHHTSGSILATSRNKVKHLSLLHCLTQARGYNTRTNPLPLLHTGKEDPFPLLHTSERVFTGFLGTENLIQHLIPTRAFKQGKHSQHATHENYLLPTKYIPSHHAWKIKSHNHTKIHVSHMYLIHTKYLVKCMGKK